MNTTIAGLAAAAALFASSTATAADLIHQGGMTGPEVAAWLQKAGYRAQLEKDGEGAPMIKSAVSGTNFTVWFYDCEGERCRALQFDSSYEMKTPLTAEKMNEWNRTHRYLKAYVDDGGDPYVQYDVNVNAGRTLSGLDDDFATWISLLDQFEDFIGW